MLGGKIHVLPLSENKDIDEAHMMEKFAFSNALAQSGMTRPT